MDAETLRKFYREIQIMRAMRHPHIVRLYQVFESDRAIFVVMEYANCGEVFGKLLFSCKIVLWNASRQIMH